MSEFDYEEESSGAAIPDFLRDPMGIPGRRWPWILLGLVVGLGATAAGVLSFVPRYQASASIVVSSQYIPEDFVRTTVRDDPFAQLNALVGQVLSRAKLASLIEKYDLYPGLRDQEPMAEIVGIMRGDIEIEPQAPLQRQRGRIQESSRVYLISYTSLAPKTSANVANALAGLFLEAGLKNRMEQAIGITSFLKKELSRAEEELRIQNNEISAFKERFRGELPDDLESNLSRLERLQSQTESAERQLTEAESRLAVLSATDDDPNSPQARLRELKARLDRELAVNTAEHPNVASLQRQVEAVEREVAAMHGASESSSRAALIASAQRNIESLQENIVKYEEEAKALDVRIGRTAQRQEELDSMTQRATVLRENYLEFLRKVDEAELAQTLESNQYGSQISIMDSAHPPSLPVSSRRKMLAMGLVGTIALSVGLALLFEMLNPLIIDAEQVERLSGLPVLGAMPRIQ